MGQRITLVEQFGKPTFTSLRTIGNTTVGNNLTVSGSITAQSLVVNTTSIYSGSTRFGSIISNTHQFTGSILTSGSITVVGQYNGSGAGLTSIPNSATTATNANTANTIVTRDASGNFSAGTITATLTGNISGNAATVTTNANLTGNVTSVGNATTIASGVVTNAMLAGSIANNKLSNSTISGIALGSNLATLTISSGLDGTSYNGSGAITINIAALGVTNAMLAGSIANAKLSNSTISGIALGSNLATLTIGTYLTGTSYNGSTAVTIATNATSANTASTLVARDASGNFSAGTITAALSGNATSATSATSATTATTAGALTSMNISQFTNNSGYITSAGTATAISQTVTGTNSAELVRGNMADNDQFRILIGGTASNAGYVEIATADDGTEPIYVRQYTGVFSSVTRTATLLDGSGNTSFPGNISGAYILGSYFNASAGNSENPTIGQIWTQNTTDNYLRKSTPAHLISQLGLITTSNYSSYALPLSGGTISGNVTINGSSNIPLTINESQPYLHINATGNTNTAGIRIYPSTGGYNAEIGNFRDGALNIYAKNLKMGQFRQYSVLNDLQMGEGGSTSMGSISLYLSNYQNGYEGRIGGGNIDGNTHFYHRNNASSFSDVGYFNQSGFYIDVLGGPSDIRLKDIIETNPVITIDGIDVIKYTFKSNPLLTRYGYSAQQVQSVLSDLVTINSPIGGPVDEGTLMLNYNDLHVLKIAALERKVAQLEADVAALKL